jgi:hypothetical protein
MEAVGGKKQPQPVTPGKGIPGNLRDLPVFQFQPGQKIDLRPGPHEDNSLTQFVILALWAAQKHGIPAERSLAFVEARFRSTQSGDGTWGYTIQQAIARTDSMTCAGLLGLAVGRGVGRDDPAQRGSVPGKAGKQDLATDPAIHAALMYLGTRVKMNDLAAQQRALAELTELKAQLSKTKNAAERKLIQKRIQELNKMAKPTANRGKIIGANAWGDLYFLWSLERVAVVYDLATIGGKDWYGWGAEILIAAQQQDGSWKDAFPGMVDTSFALLFLKQVNVAEDLTDRLLVMGGARDPGASPDDQRGLRVALAGVNKNTSGDGAGLLRPRTDYLPRSGQPARPAGRRRRLLVAADEDKDVDQTSEVLKTSEVCCKLPKS